MIPHGCEASRLAAAGLDVPFETFSLNPDSDWWAADVRPTAEGLRFRIFRRGEYFTEIVLRSTQDVPASQRFLRHASKSCGVYRMPSNGSSRPNGRIALCQSPSFTERIFQDLIFEANPELTQRLTPDVAHRLLSQMGNNPENGCKRR